MQNNSDFEPKPVRIEVFVRGVKNIQRFNEYKQREGIIRNATAALELIKKSLDREIPEEVSAI